MSYYDFILMKFQTKVKQYLIYMMDNIIFKGKADIIIPDLDNQLKTCIVDKKININSNEFMKKCMDIFERNILEWIFNEFEEEIPERNENDENYENYEKNNFYKFSNIENYFCLSEFLYLFQYYNNINETNISRNIIELCDNKPLTPIFCYNIFANIEICYNKNYYNYDYQFYKYCKKRTQDIIKTHRYECVLCYENKQIQYICCWCKSCFLCESCFYKNRENSKNNCPLCRKEKMYLELNMIYNNDNLKKNSGFLEWLMNIHNVNYDFLTIFCMKNTGI